MNYSLSEKPKDPRNPEAGKVWIATPQANRVIKKDEFIEYVADRDANLRSDLKKCLDKISQGLRQQLKMGNKVDLGDLGSFFVTFDSKPFEGETAENFDCRCIKAVKARWYPSKKMERLDKSDRFDTVQKIEFKMVSSRKIQRRAIKAIKNAETEIRLKDEDEGLLSISD